MGEEHELKLKEILLEFLQARLKEKSTWLAMLSLILLYLGHNSDPNNLKYYIELVIGLNVSANFLVKEQKDKGEK